MLFSVDKPKSTALKCIHLEPVDLKCSSFSTDDLFPDEFKIHSWKAIKRIKGNEDMYLATLKAQWATAHANALT